MSRRTLIILIVCLLVIGGIVWFTRKNNSTTATPVLSIAAQNQTKNASAQSVNASPSDVIVYTLTAENQSDSTIPGYIMEVNISDITNKASLVDASGASYNSATNSLVWTPLDIAAHDSIVKTFSIKINSTTPANSTIKITFNNEVDVTVGSIAVKPTPTPTPTPANPKTAPKTGTSEWLPVWLALITTIFLGIKFRRKLV